MLLTYPTFYRRYGVRLVTQVAAPKLSEMAQLDFPIGSIYHYVTHDGVELGPPSDDYLFRNITKPILVSHVLELGDDKGNPRSSGVNVQSMIRDYHVKHRRTRQLRSLETAQRDQLTLVAFNYCLLSKSHRYVRSFFTEYFKWCNEFAAVTKAIASATAETDRQHYIFAKIPKVIPSLQQLNLASQGMNQNLLKVFRGEESFLLLELWKWLGAERAQSLFAKIPANKIHLVNIIYQESAKWCVLNLGVFNSFRNNLKDEDAKQYLTPVTQALEPDQLQKRLLRMMMTLMEVRTLTANVDAPVEDTPVPAVQSSMLTKMGNDDEDDDEQGDSEYRDTPDEDAVPVFVVEKPLPAEEIQLDEDDEARAKRLAEEDARLDDELSQLNEIAARQEEQSIEDEAPLAEVIFHASDDALEKGITSICDRLADDGLLSAGEYRHFTKLASQYKTLAAPDGKSTLGDYINVPPEMLTITQSSSVPDNITVLDKSMLKSSLLDFDERYITEVMERDTAAMVLNVQKAGVAVTNYQVEKVHNILGGYETHRIRVTPVVGQQSTLHFKLPLVSPDGTFTSNGIKYFLRKQRGDLPIRKVGPSRVALTSYYGKAFVNRGKKKANDYGYWLQCQITLRGINKEDTSITNFVADNVFDPEFECPRSFSAIAGVAKSFDCRGFSLFFDTREKEKNYPLAVIKSLERGGNVLLGKSAAGAYLVLDKGGTVYIVNGKEMVPFGSLESFLNVPLQSAPVESAGLVVFGKEIPIGVILAYNIGFEKLLRLLKVQPRRVDAGARLHLQAHEYAIAFSDETLVFSRDDRFAAMVLAGFNDYHRAVKLFSVYSFDKRGVYLNLLEANGLGTRYVREIDLMYAMFVDPITKDLLTEMKEPTTMQGLLLRSCELLLTDKTPDELDPAFMRIKGYERMSGAVYAELIQSLRAHNSRLGKSNAPIEMNPYAVWKRISEDPAKSQVGEINPIKAIKESEAVTYAGAGGRNKRSMTKRTRAFHPNDMGTISESTVDSSDVGINIFTPADPQFTSLRGMSKRFVIGQTGASALLSTSALLAMGCDRDDPKRVNFVAIQQEHSIACDGYRQFTVRTGYDSVVAHRSHDLFAFTAKKEGVVRSVNPKGIIVDYADETVQGYELGRRFGSASGLTIPHNVVSPLKAGDKVAVGDVICYNDGFFEPDFFNPKQVVWKNAFNVKTVLWESTQTLEDASSISKRVESRLSAKVTKLKTVVLNFDQSISRLLKVGQVVEADTILCIIEDAVTANNKLFDEQTLDTLRTLDQQTPRAHVKGVVEKIEVFYHGEKEDMSETLRAVADASDRELKRNASALGRPAYTGAVDGGFRIDNNQLVLDSLAIRIYITSSVTAGVGD